MPDSQKPAKSFAVGRDDAPAALKGAVVAIGNFDGVHLGHRAVIAAAQRRAALLGRPAAALTFSPHPRAFFQPRAPLFRLNDERSKLRLLAGTGLDGAILMTFDATLAATPAEDFIVKILHQRFAIGGAAIGFDFHFGKDRGGSPDLLRRHGERLGFAVDIVAPLEDEGRPVSSGAVRAALGDGKVVEAAELLGMPWFVSGEVIHGDKRGRAIGYPTANMELGPYLRPRFGIYAVTGRILATGEELKGAANLGVRPSFEPPKELLEPYFFDFDRELYGQEIEVALCRFLRPEMKFAGLDGLKAQMAKDCAQARTLLA
jgi:riboflavin kinase/FMN adenylyltransferase